MQILDYWSSPASDWPTRLPKDKQENASGTLGAKTRRRRPSTTTSSGIHHSQSPALNTHLPGSITGLRSRRGILSAGRERRDLSVQVFEPASPPQRAASQTSGKLGHFASAFCPQPVLTREGIIGRAKRSRRLLDTTYSACWSLSLRPKSKEPGRIASYVVISRVPLQHGHHSTGKPTSSSLLFAKLSGTPLSTQLPAALPLLHLSFPRCISLFPPVRYDQTRVCSSSPPCRAALTRIIPPPTCLAPSSGRLTHFLPAWEHQPHLDFHNSAV